MRVTPAAALPDLGLVGRPADAVQQSRIAGRMVRDARRDDLSGLEVGDLHSPEVSHIVYGVAARAVDRVRSEDARIRPDPRYRIAARIDQIQVTAASVVGLRFLEKRPGKRGLSVVRSVGEGQLWNNVARIGLDDHDGV